jgi:hypothetical protein
MKYPVDNLGWEEPQKGVRPTPNRILWRGFPRLEAISFIQVVKRFPVVEYFNKIKRSVVGEGGKI